MRLFISAGWPYMYDVPGLHNCIPMLFADLYARFFRWMGDEVFFLSGGDEHGARIEFMARGYGKEPKVLVDEKYEQTVPLLRKLGLSFEEFGRTTDPRHEEFVRNLMEHLLNTQEVILRKQLVPYCLTCDLHLPDRFLEGQCPFCGEASYGGQCNNKRSCGRLIESVDDGRCAVCGGGYELRERLHAVLPLTGWREEVLSAIRCDGPRGEAVRERVIETFDTVNEVVLTRDSWGIEVPLGTGASQSVYSWVDSLLGKVSYVAFSGDTAERDFWKNDDTRRLFFLGMDGVPFYGALLPALLLAAQDGYSIANWTILPNEVLIYEGGVCSKSGGRGIWLQEALAVAEADFWRFSLFYSYAETEGDVDFQWGKFTDVINRYLMDGLEANVERLISAPADRADLDRVRSIEDHLRRFDSTQAFLELLEVIADPDVGKGTLLAVLPLLSCYIPEVAGRALGKLKGQLPPSVKVLNQGRVDGHELRLKYEKLADERRAAKSLQEEVTDMRADALCVCPINLEEQ